MALRGNYHRIFRIVFAYGAVGLILLICLCASLYSALATWLQVAFDGFPNIFRRRWSDPFTESDDGTSEEELQTSPQSASILSADTNPEYTTSSQTFHDPTERLNTEAEKATDKQAKNDQISAKDSVSNLEGLALQMVHFERHRISTDLPCRASSGECSVRSPNEPLSVNMPVPKSVLKSSCSETKHPTSTRGTRRIRFQDPTFSEVSKGSDSASMPILKLRKLKPAAYHQAGLNFQESPAMSSEKKICTTAQSLQTLQTKKAPMINLSSEISSNQQLANEEIDFLSEESNSPIPSALISESATYQQKSNESLESLTEELNSTIPTEFSTETADNQQLSNESMNSLSEVLNPTIPTAVSTENATNQQVTNKSIDSLSEVLNSPNLTELSSETATCQQLANEPNYSLMEELNSTISTAFKEFEESPKEGNQYFKHERVESTSNLNAEERSLEQTSEEISTKIKEIEVEELRSQSLVKEDAASSNEKEEYFKIADTDDICELPGESKTVNDGDSSKAKNLHSESDICQQSTKESKKANQSKSTSSDKLNPAMVKTDEEACKSLESENHFKLESVESIGISVHKEASPEIINQKLNEMEAEKLRDDSFEKRDGILSKDEDAFKKEEGKNDVSQALKTVDAVLQPEVVTDQQPAEESMSSSDGDTYFRKEGNVLQHEVATDQQSAQESLSSIEEEALLKTDKEKNVIGQALITEDGALHSEAATDEQPAEKSMYL